MIFPLLVELTAAVLFNQVIKLTDIKINRKRKNKINELSDGLCLNIGTIYLIFICLIFFFKFDIDSREGGVSESWRQRERPCSC